MNNDFMRKRKIVPLVLSMSLPMVLSMLVNSLYNIVDSYYVASISDDAMTALSLVFPVQNFTHAVAVGFGVGINALVAFSLGAKKDEERDRAATNGLVFALLHAAVMTVSVLLIMRPFLSLFTEDEDILALALEYSNVVFLFIICDVLTLVFEKIYQAEGKMRLTMVALLSGCVFNIIMDPVFIFTFGLGIKGAAIATGLGQALTCSIYIVSIILHRQETRFRRKYIKADKATVKKLYAVGIPATLNIALPSFLITALNSILASVSASGILALGIYYKLQSFLYLPSSGFVQGMRPLISYNMGAGKEERAERIFRFVLLMCASIMALGTLLSLLFPSVFISIFSKNSQTVSEGSRALSIISLGFVFSSYSVAASGALEALSKGMLSLLISIFRYILIIPLAFILVYFMHSSDGVWHSFWIMEAITAVLSFFLMRRTFKMR